jgi:hypothetical protein
MEDGTYYNIIIIIIIVVVFVVVVHEYEVQCSTEPAGRPTVSQLNSTTRINCCIYTIYVLMMGYKYARNM